MPNRRGFLPESLTDWGASAALRGDHLCFPESSFSEGAPMLLRKRKNRAELNRLLKLKANLRPFVAEAEA